MWTFQGSEPSYLPSGYRLSRRVDGVEAGGLGISANQVGFAYRRGDARDDWHSPLATVAIVFLVPANL